MKPSIIEEKGFTWVALPREGIVPFILLEKVSNGFFKRIQNSILEILGMPLSVSTLNADVFSLFPKPESGRGDYPSTSPPEKISFLKGHDILDAEGGFDFKGLEGLELIGSAGAQVKLQKAHKLLYNFKKSHQLSVNSEILLEEHLNIHKPVTKAVGFLEKLRKGKLYVVTDVLQTTSFSIQDASDFRVEGSIDLKAVEDYVAKINAAGKMDSQNNDQMGYKGDSPVTFALKASNIQYNKQSDGYSIHKAPLKDVRSFDKGETNELEERVISID